MDQQPFQCFHVQLQGGAPWGFTLKGGLEHGENLIISKIEDGGKASMCEKMEVGDELVNINGTPLYGSRQEALILIKGSYKILKMIVRRNVPAIRPHSWHLAKLSEVHPDVANMQYPTDAFSLSWHSGCENSELPMQWNPLSRHCSTDKSSSIGSMESLDQPAQNYYEGTLSPIDPGMYQNKRDSAYSSFSASSNASDYTVSARTEESVSIDCILQGLGPCKQSEGRYLQTGQRALETQEESSTQSIDGHPQRPSSFPYDTNHSGSIKAPPQPPVRRDSLRASKGQLGHGERRRASAPGDSMQVSGRWPSEALQQRNSKGLQCQCELGLCTVHMKESLSADQYYMLSSQTDRGHQNTDGPNTEDKERTNECTKMQPRWSGDRGDLEGFNHNMEGEVTCYTIPHVKEALSKPASFRQHLKSPCVRSPCREGSNVQAAVERDEWTTSPSHGSHQCQTDQCNSDCVKEHMCIRKECNNRRDSEVSKANALASKGDQFLGGEEERSRVQHCPTMERSVNESNEVREASASFLPNDCAGDVKSSCCTETLLEGCRGQEESRGPAKKPGSSRHRSAQMRRKSDRFATNLRTEIQRRKAQLQKSKGSSVLLCGEEPVEEREEPTDCQSLPRPGPPPPPPKNKSRLLEIKRANAEQFGKPMDSLNLEPKNHEVNVKNNGEKHNHKRDQVESILGTMEGVPTGEGMSLILSSKPQSDVCRAESTESLHPEPLNHKSTQRDNQKNGEWTSANSKRETPQREIRSPRTEGCREVWRGNPAEISHQKHKSSEQGDHEVGRTKERTTLGVKWNDTHRVSPHPDVMVPNEVWRMGSSKSISSTESQSEDLGRNGAEGTTEYNTPLSLGLELKWNGLQSNREPSCSEENSNEEWRVNSLENMAHEPRIQECRMDEVRRSGECPSVCEAQWKSPCPSSDFENRLAQQMPHGGRWTWSAEHKLQPHVHVAKGSPPLANGMNIEVAIPPIRRVTEEHVLMPFADRRRFFEDSSKVCASHIPSMHLKQSKTIFCPSLPDPPLSQMVASDLRRRSVDHTYHPSSPNRPDSAMPYSEYCVSHAMEQPMCCNQGGHSSEYLHPMAYGCGVHESCVYCSTELCPAVLKRNMPTSHLGCHSLHHHHRHQWARCGDYLCPTQRSIVEEGSSIHSDPWHVRKPFLQEVPVKEWTQPLKINRKCSQSTSELSHYKFGFHHPGPYRPCCDSADHDWPQCYRAVSTHDLSCDRDRPLREAELASFEDGPSFPGLARGRAYSESQLNFEGLAARDRREPPLAKLDERQREPPALLKKQGPPRPPPPNWDKYRERRASHQSSNSDFVRSKVEAAPQERSLSVEAVRQRSRSLPLDKAFLKMSQASPPSSTRFTPGSPGSPVLRPAGLRHYGAPPGALQLPTSPDHDNVRLGTYSEGQRTPTDTRSPARSQKGDTVPPDSIPPLRGQTFAPSATAEVRSEETREDSTGNPEDIPSCPQSPSLPPAPTTSEITGRDLPTPSGDLFEAGDRLDEDDWSESSIHDRFEFQPISPPPVCGAVSPTSCAAYFNTSAAKAGLLNKMKEMPGVQEEGDSAAGAEEENELMFRKIQLIDSISRKLSVLHEAQQGLMEDIGANATLGYEVGELLKSLCKPNEYDKFRIFIGDLDKVVNLLLSLSGRLARVESALSSEDPEPTEEEKLTLLEKKKQLSDQLEDARELRAHVDRRERMVLETVSRYLTEEQLQDYHHYVKMTSALIVEQRELEDKIRLGEEQLRCLRESL
ncbi:protein Shroom4 isoform X3 [Ascaphus truei]|uniref:protein Shroom4 isoform X3 n=1 Tax=Ascaphus truei TaxID=8439 RepID=UPI003F592173